MLDQLTKGIQKKLEQAANLAVRGEAALDLASDSFTQLAGDAMDALLSGLSEIPAVGTLAKAVRALTNATRNVKTNEEQCRVLLLKTRQVTEVIVNATDIDCIEKYTQDCAEVVDRAAGFVKTLQGQGFFGKLRGTLRNRDAKRITAFISELDNVVGQLNSQTMLHIARSMASTQQSAPIVAAAPPLGIDAT